MAPYTLDLTSAWLKFKRAKCHVDTLWQKMRDRLGNNKNITLGFHFDPEDNSIVIRITKMEEVPNDWSLIFGDAAYNLRCALDHLAWQLAIRKFDGVEPTDFDIIKLIQFPIALTPEAWRTHINRKHMLAADADKLAKFQPFTNTNPLWSIAPLGVLCGKSGLQNIDKHRSIHMTYMAPHALQLTGIGEPGEKAPIELIHCKWRVIDGHVEIPYILGARALKLGDEVTRLPVIPTGPNPDVKLNADFSFYVAIGEETIPVLDVLVQSVNVTEDILGEFT